MKSNMKKYIAISAIAATLIASTAMAQVPDLFYQMERQRMEQNRQNDAIWDNMRRDTDMRELLEQQRRIERLLQEQQEQQQRQQKKRDLDRFIREMR